MKRPLSTANRWTVACWIGSIALFLLGAAQFHGNIIRQRRLAARQAELARLRALAAQLAAAEGRLRRAAEHRGGPPDGCGGGPARELESQILPGGWRARRWELRDDQPAALATRWMCWDDAARNGGGAWLTAVEVESAAPAGWVRTRTEWMAVEPMGAEK